MRILIAYASKHGSTKGIAELICQHVREKGLQADVFEVSQAIKIRDYDAFIIGSALYMGHWMEEAKQFVSRNKDTLSSRPVWLFSSGPTGNESLDSKGRSLLDPTVSGPLELGEIKKELQNVKDHRVFFGAFYIKDMGFLTKQLMKSSVIRKAVPEGDFRDWQEIGSWATEIANALLA